MNSGHRHLPVRCARPSIPLAAACCLAQAPLSAGLSRGQRQRLPPSPGRAITRSTHPRGPGNQAWPAIGKAFITCAAGRPSYMVRCRMGMVRGKLNQGGAKALRRSAGRVPAMEAMIQVLATSAKPGDTPDQCAGRIFIGRGLTTPSLEAHCAEDLLHPFGRPMPPGTRGTVPSPISDRELVIAIATRTNSLRPCPTCGEVRPLGGACQTFGQGERLGEDIADGPDPNPRSGRPVHP